MRQASDWQSVTSGRSGVEVRTDGERFLKRCTDLSPRGQLLRQGLTGESLVLRYLNSEAFPAPCLEEAGEHHLITHRLPGTSLRKDFRRQHEGAIVRTLVEWFTRLHRLEVPLDMPDRGVEAELAEARARLEMGLVKVEVVRTKTGFSDPVHLWIELKDSQPTTGTARLTHGDPWPCNLLFEAATGSGIIDWARAGAGPAERDLAVLELALNTHYSSDAADLFWSGYGRRPYNLSWFQQLSWFF